MFWLGLYTGISLGMGAWGARAEQHESSWRLVARFILWALVWPLIVVFLVGFALSEAIGD